MNDKIDTIQNFWRNHLMEGDTRFGIYVCQTCSAK